MIGVQDRHRQFISTSSELVDWCLTLASWMSISLVWSGLAARFSEAAALSNCSQLGPTLIEPPPPRSRRVAWSDRPSVMSNISEALFCYLVDGPRASTSIECWGFKTYCVGGISAVICYEQIVLYKIKQIQYHIDILVASPFDP